MTFGQRLREQRERNEYTQAMLAARCGLQPSSIAHFEADRRAPSLDNLRKLVGALDTSANYLLGLEAHPQSEDYQQGYADALDDVEQDMQAVIGRLHVRTASSQQAASAAAISKAAFQPRQEEG